MAYFSGEFGCVHLGRVLLSQEDNSILCYAKVAIKALKSKHKEYRMAGNIGVNNIWRIRYFPIFLKRWMDFNLASV